MQLSAVLFDVDGTIAETEDLHRRSFNESFKEFNLDWFWDKPIYKELINIGGGKERIQHYMKRAWPEMLEYKNLSKYIDSIHKVKNEIYEDYVNDEKLILRPGVKRLISEILENKIRIALVSSSSKKNIENLFLKGLDIDPFESFDLIAHGDCTKNKKPSPEIYEWTLEKLKLSAQSCIAIEDSPRGLDSAISANIKVIVTPSELTTDESFMGAELVISDLGEAKKPFKQIHGKTHGEEFVNINLLKKIIESQK